MGAILNFLRIACAALAVAGIAITVGNVLIGHFLTAGMDLLGSFLWGAFFGIASFARSKIDERKRLSGFGGDY